MMQISRNILLSIAPTYRKDRIDEDVKVFNEWAGKFGITTPKRMAYFLGQCAHESGGFIYVEEIASGKAYELRKDLGNVHAGDGVRYKGRGYIQVTGKANYRAYQQSGFCVGNLLEHPEWLCNSPGRVKASLWFWWKKGLNAYADRDDFLKITKIVNGGYNGLKSRRMYTERAMKVLKVK